MPHPNAQGTGALSLDGLVQRAYDMAGSAQEELDNLQGGIRNTNQERKHIARALAELKDAAVCLEALLARL